MSTQFCQLLTNQHLFKKKKKKKKKLYIWSQWPIVHELQSTMLGIFMVFNIFMILIQINSNIWG